MMDMNGKFCSTSDLPWKQWKVFYWLYRGSYCLMGTADSAAPLLSTGNQESEGNRLKPGLPG